MNEPYTVENAPQWYGSEWRIWTDLQLRVIAGLMNQAYHKGMGDLARNFDLRVEPTRIGPDPHSDQ